MIYNNYLNGVAIKMTGGSYTIPSHMAFGSTTGTLTATDIVTSGEFDRNALDSATQVDYVAKFVGRRLSTEANSEVINVAGLHNTSTLASSGNLQTNMLIASLVHTTDFDVEVEFWVKHERL